MKGNPTVAVVVSNSDSTKFIATLNVISRLSYRSIPNFPILRCRDAEFVLGKLENGNELLVLNGHCSSGSKFRILRIFILLITYKLNYINSGM